MSATAATRTPTTQTRALIALLRPWVPLLAGVVACVLAGAALELAPPLLLRRIVDGHLIPRRPDGLVALALLYLAATTAGALTGFLVDYLTATAAQSASSALLAAGAHRLDQWDDNRLLRLFGDQLLQLDRDHL